MTLDDGGATVLDVLNRMKVIQGEAGFIILNSKIASEDAVLKDGDILEYFSNVKMFFRRSKNGCI